MTAVAEAEQTPTEDEVPAPEAPEVSSAAGTSP